MGLTKAEREELEFIRKHADALIARSNIRVPDAIVFGHYEKLEEGELLDHYHDIKHECERRNLL